jgi:hypothetical protein
MTLAEFLDAYELRKRVSDAMKADIIAEEEKDYYDQLGELIEKHPIVSPRGGYGSANLE